MANPETENVPREARNAADWNAKLSNIVNQMLRGKLNNGNRTLTLTAGAATTVVTDSLCSVRSHIALMPTTANASAAMATSYVTVSDGSFTVTHANNAQTDRTFSYTVTG